MKSINLNVMNTEYKDNYSKADKSEKKENGSFFVGNSSIGKQGLNSVEQKRAEARKQATKMIMDQFAGDCVVTDDIKERRLKIDDLNSELKELNKQRDYYAEAKDKLKEDYKIEDDSPEQKNLELLERANRARKNGGMFDFTKEELKTIEDTAANLTEYQTRALGYDSMIEPYDERITEAREEILLHRAAIKGDKAATLKMDGIIKTGKSADKVLASASKAVMGMLYQDAREAIDKEMQELVEAAKKEAEKKEEQEAQIEAAKEKSAEAVLEEKTEPEKNGEDIITEITNDQKQLKQEIDKILKENELLKDALKGLMVDELL